uniref:Uncharacterized protein n=1 Tax=Plectus sambesii TaxID=2011161 RepID=A0A914VYH8_9BILA
MSKKSSGGSTFARDRNIGTIQADLFTRPSTDFSKEGSSGKQITCVTNFVPVLTFPDFELHQYHVSFSPPVDSKQYRKVILKRFTSVLGDDFVFDGMILYSPKATLGTNFDLNGQHPTTGEAVKVNVRRTVTFMPNDPQAINIYNLLVRRSFESMGYHQVQRNFYDPARACTVQNYNIELWPGYLTAIRLHEDNLLMCIENSHKLLRRNTVLDLMLQAFNRAGGQDAAKRSIQNDIIGNTVMTMYNNKLYRIDDIIWDMNPTSILTKFDGTEITFAEYYQQQYDKVVTDMKQPLLFSRAKHRGQSGGQSPAESRDVYLIPELCNLTGLTDAMRVDRRVMQALAQHTRLSPTKRIQSSLEYLRKFHNTPDIKNVFGQWSVTLGAELATVTARELPVEELRGRSQTPYSYAAASGDWAREARAAGMLRTVGLATWLLIFHRNDYRKAERFFSSIRDIARGMNMSIEPPIVIELPDDATSAFVQGITNGIEKAGRRRVEMVVCVVPNDNKTRYDAIKKVCCLEKPVPTQVVKSQTLDNEKNFQSVCLKIVLQMNCKLGGSLWRVSIPDAMIVGYDLYHDSTLRGKTVGAAVSSLDTDYTQWYSQCELHGNPTELGENLGKFIEEALKQRYDRCNNTLPGRIIIYRDGCGDGQIPFVKQHEVRLVRDAIRAVGKLLAHPDYNPGLAFVIVTKRVNIRYFKQPNHPGGELLNPVPGTVVDSVITRPERYDWYLVPQCVRQGTVTPVNYNVIEDTTGLSPDHHQRLAYKLCHLYYNWQGTIRVPAPCQYAQKLAFLVSQSLHESAKEAYLIYYVYNFYRKVAKYPPGPTPLPIIGNLHQLEAINTHKQFERWSKVYGPVFTVFFPAPTVIITHLPEIKEALIKKGDLFADRPPGPITDVFSYVKNGGIGNSSGPSWREQRRFAVHTLRDFGMGRNVMEEKIMSSVATMFEQVDDCVAADAFDMNWPLQLCIGNIINELLLGYHWQADDCEKFIHFKDCLEFLFRQMRERKSFMVIQAYPWLKHVPYLGYIGWHELRETMNNIFGFMASEIEEHKKQLDYDSEPTDFVAAYLQELKRRERTGESNEYLSERNLIGTLSDFWIAGMETTATTLRWAIVFLVAYQDVQKKMRKEIDEVVGRDRRPTMTDKMNLPYSTAVVLEMQRKANIVTFNVPRYTTAATEIGGHSIPAHTTIVAQITTVHDSSDAYSDPDRFDSAHFLESDGKAFNKTAMDHLVPFSLGKRQCAGESLARMELFLVVFSLVQRYSLDVPKGGALPDLTPIFGTVLTPHPYKCKVTLRT